ncbi:MAG TPA: type VI secretion system baseplate subunit TssG [Bryobacteraceae bacterium]|jgi:type VI secretion system protein ImpH|nr:type VI secretion system baseplate subunit TssG [Bryobacteraceae bacterium]
MASTAYGWERAASLREWLLHEPYRFEFYQAVRLLEGFTPKALVSGGTEGAEQGAVRFRSRVSLSFPASEVHDLEWTAAVPRLTVNFLGLGGALGPLPAPYTEMILEAKARKDHSAADFLDIFNHRLVTMLYRARKAHDPALTARPPHQGSFAEHLFALIGLALPPARNTLGFPAQRLLSYAGMLARQPRTAAGLEVMLADHFGIRVRVRQFVGRWRHIDSSQWTQLGRRGTNQELGAGAVLGTRAWDQAGRIAIRIGPLSLDRFRQFLPGSAQYAEISRLARFYLGIEHTAEAHLLLQRDQAPPSRLGQAQLGFTSWLLSKRHSQAVPSVRVRLEN